MNKTIDKRILAEAPLGQWRGWAMAIDAGATQEEAQSASELGLDLKEYSYVRKAGATHEQIVELIGRGADLRRLQSWFGAGHSVPEMIFAIEQKGLDYFWLRDIGVTREEVVKLVESDGDPTIYKDVRGCHGSHEQALWEARNPSVLFRRWEARDLRLTSGVTYNEIVAVLSIDDSHLICEPYKRLRGKGVSHAHAMEVIDASVDAVLYLAGRDSGQEHEVALGLLTVGIYPIEVNEAIEAGAKVDEIVTIEQEDLISYNFWRHDGFSHREFVEVKEAGADVTGYTSAREHLDNHAGLLKLHADGISLEQYARFRHIGASDAEALEAIRASVDFEDYRFARKKGIEHKQIMALYQAAQVTS